MILQSLSCHLSDAQVDYESLHGIHRFLISRGASRVKVGFAEDELSRKGVEDLQVLVHQIVKKVRAVANAALMRG
jgi:hypothetical protein